VRRFTGGGLVEHGEDLTFALTIPPRTGLALADTATRYRQIHEALAGALLEAGVPVIPVSPDSDRFPRPLFREPGAVGFARSGLGNQARGRGPAPLPGRGLASRQREAPGTTAFAGGSLVGGVCLRTVPDRSPLSSPRSKPASSPASLLLSRPATGIRSGMRGRILQH
jgi:hypothetical protein